MDVLCSIPPIGFPEQGKLCTVRIMKCDDEKIVIWKNHQYAAVNNMISADSNMSIDLGNRCHAVSNCSDSGAVVAK